MRATISPKYQVVIPRELRESLRLKPGEKTLAEIVSEERG